MQDESECDPQSIHREAQDYAELRTGLEVALHSNLAEHPQEVASLFFRSYDEFAERLGQPSMTQRKLEEARLNHVAARLAQQATIARFPESEHLFGAPGMWPLDDPIRSFLRSCSAEARFFFTRTRRLLQDALDERNNVR